MAKLNFTKKALTELRPPGGSQRAYYFDKTVRGLGLAVTPGGRKSFILYRKIQGRPERISIGPFPDLSIDQARGMASELNSRIARGENPAEEKRAVGQRATLGEIFEQYLERHLNIHTRRWQDAEGIFKLYLSHWRTRAAADIRPADVAALHAKLGRERGQYTANRAVELLRAAFNRAAKWGYTGPNPARGVTPFREQSRERFLRAHELPAFFEALAQDENATARDFLLICLLTGARSGNVKAMRWDQVSLERATWAIPTTKSGDPHVAVLAPAAVALLEERWKTATGPWVFPGDGRTGHIRNPKGCWKRVLKRANLQDLRLHDLRRTLGSWQAATGASLPIIGKTLGHKSLSATAVYARLDLEPVRAAVDKATVALLEAANQPRQVKEKQKVHRE